MAILEPQAPEAVAAQRRLLELAAEHPAPCQKSGVDMVPESAAALRRATQVCGPCPMAKRTDCLLYALLGFEDYGVWGGLTPDERKMVKKLAKAEPEADLSLPGLDFDTTHQGLAWAVQVYRDALDAQAAAGAQRKVAV